LRCRRLGRSGRHRLGRRSPSEAGGRPRRVAPACGPCDSAGRHAPAVGDSPHPDPPRPASSFVVFGPPAPVSSAGPPGVPCISRRCKERGSVSVCTWSRLTVAALRLTLLGGFEAQVDGGSALRVSTRKAQALLAYLALPLGQRHARDELAA